MKRLSSLTLLLFANFVTIIVTASTAFTMIGCEDKAIVTAYHKDILSTHIKCIKLSVFPKNKSIQDTLKSLYNFTQDCDLILEVSYKDDIHCNSNQNAQLKAVNGFPSSYIKMELRRGMTLQYSYYLDLNANISSDDIKKGFERLRDDLDIK